MLAQFAQAIKPERRELKDEHTQQLNALLARRRQILTMLTAERQRLALAAPAVRRDIKEHIHFLVKRLKDSNRGLDEALRVSAVWLEREELFKPVKGVGKQTLYSLCALLPELGWLERRKLAALVGVASRSTGTPAHCMASVAAGAGELSYAACCTRRPSMRCASIRSSAPSISACSRPANPRRSRSLLGQPATGLLAGRSRQYVSFGPVGR